MTTEDQELESAHAKLCARGHEERSVGKRTYCSACGKDKPRKGGWDGVCVPVPVKERREARKLAEPAV